MSVETLRAEHIGPIEAAHVRFGDLTVLVGPQATGKSILLQLFRLLLDTGPILRTLRRHGLEWRTAQGEETATFLDLYFGEGTRGLWERGRSRIEWRGRGQSLDDLVLSKAKRAQEKAFFIPAQRVLALSREGWFRPFSDYRAGDPFSVRDFSEKLRLMMESPLGRTAALFPQPRRLKAEIKNLLSDHIFRGFHLEIERVGPQKRLLLTGPDGSVKLPYLVWSAGQREFVPLLLGLYWLLPPTKSKRRGPIQWVIIEELEAGLHPKAIEVMLFTVLDLLWRDYRVCLSSHCSHVLDMVWGLRNLREHREDPKRVLEMFGVKNTPATLAVAKRALEKQARVYYFDPKTQRVADISELNPESQDPIEAGWGGLTEFSGRVTELVSHAAASPRR